MTQVDGVAITEKDLHSDSFKKALLNGTKRVTKGDLKCGVEHYVFLIKGLDPGILFGYNAQVEKFFMKKLDPGFTFYNEYYTKEYVPSDIQKLLLAKGDLLTSDPVEIPKVEIKPVEVPKVSEPPKLVVKEEPKKEIKKPVIRKPR